MARARKTPGGLSVFPAIRVSEGPPEVWAAIAVDRRLKRVQVAMGQATSAHAAEMEALAKLGATPDTVRAALGIPPDDDTE